jgi:hypothetical protein
MQISRTDQRTAFADVGRVFVQTAVDQQAVLVQVVAVHNDGRGSDGVLQKKTLLSNRVGEK